MNFNAVITLILILLSGVGGYAQAPKYKQIADVKVDSGVDKKKSEYVVTVEEASKMSLDAVSEYENGWQKINWRAMGISLVVPEEFQFVAHRDDKLTDGWQARRWQSRLPQPNALDYKVWISVENIKNNYKKNLTDLLNEEETLLNQTDGSDTSDLPPILRVKINGVDGVISRWNIPEDIQYTWLTYRIYKGKFQKITVQVSGREEVLTGVRKILQSIKIIES